MPTPLFLTRSEPLKASAFGFAGTLVAGLVVACGSGSPGGVSTVQGTLSGMMIPNTDVVGVNETSGVGAEAITTVSLSLTNHPGTCMAIESGTTPGNLSTLRIGVTTQGMTVPIGTYTIGQGTAQVTADYDVTDANCNDTMGLDRATAGSVSFQAISSTTLQGTFNFTFADGNVMGTFTAPTCNPNANPLTTCSH